MIDGLRRIGPEAVSREIRNPVDRATLETAQTIIEDVRLRGEKAVIEHSVRLGDIAEGHSPVVDAAGLERVVDRLGDGEVELLERVASRIETFARAQRDSIRDIEIRVPGGRAGHRWFPVETAGAYVPGGRYPLPSTALMTVVPARVAGVEEVWVASPRPSKLTLAAAGIAGADGLLCVGGAQAIAAMAFGSLGPRCDVVVGPGNRWVTAAKKLLYGEIGIDGLAGPSEIVVIADETADPELVAADLIAQAEHDVDALPILITTDEAVYRAVEGHLRRQIKDLPTATVASPAIENGLAVVVEGLAQAAEVSDRIAPEHLSLQVSDPNALMEQVRNYGSLFGGAATAEAFADYGVGPNHVLPTGGGARFQSGLSPLTFLRSPTWLELTEPAVVVADTTDLARNEGLEGHARAAEARSRPASA